MPGRELDEVCSPVVVEEERAAGRFGGLSNFPRAAVPRAEKVFHTPMCRFWACPEKKGADEW